MSSSLTRGISTNYKERRRTPFHWSISMELSHLFTVKKINRRISLVVKEWIKFNVQSRWVCTGSGCHWLTSREADWDGSCSLALSRNTSASPATHVWETQQSVRACGERVAEQTRWKKLMFHLDPGGREMDCSSPLWMELLQWLEWVGGLKTGRCTRTFTFSHWSGS